ncbi:MAG: prepilin peptidase [Candidatus Krumholzibacteriia bacterium]
MTDPLAIGTATVFGLLLGSFLNVVIYRLPRGESVVVGRSRCPRCRAVIRWFDNIPLVSYLTLAGRCRRCTAAIPVRYPAVELVSAIIAALVFYHYGLSLQSVWIYGFLSTLLVVTVVDWSHRIIPDVLSLGGVVFGWAGAVVCLDLNLVESMIGSLAGGGLILAIALTYKALRKADGMGGGDVKLMAMIGAFVGWKMIFPVLFLASFVGSVYGIYLMRKGGDGKTAVAFGSFLAPAATVVFVFGARLWALYLGR